MLLAGAILPALLLCALGAYVLVHSRARYEQRAELLTQNLAAAVDHSVAVNIEKLDLALSSIVNQLESEPAIGHTDQSAARAHIRSLIARHPELDGIRVTDASGIAILGPGIEGRSPIDFSTREWFTAQRDNANAGLYMSKPVVSKITGAMIISFSRRYTTPKGEFAGGVTAAVPLAYFSRAIESINVGTHGAIILRDGNLGMIMRHPAAAINAAGEIGSSNVSPELRQLVESGRSQATYHAKVTADGVERTTTFRRLTNANLLVIVGLGKEDYLADWYIEVRTVVAFWLGIIALYAAASLLLLRMLAQNRRAHQRIDLLAKVFEHSGEAIVLSDRNYRIVEVNPAFVRQSGYTLEEVSGRDLTDFASGRTDKSEFDGMRDRVRAVGLWRGEFWDRAKDGHEYPKWMSVAAVSDASGEISHHISSSIDLTKMRQAEEKILHLAHHDALTQLPNRVLLHGRLEQAMAAARRDGSDLAMLFIDMDRFKNINDTFGHHVGDGLLVEVGKRLIGAVRGSDIVARLGGDEFVVVLTAIGKDGARAATAVAIKVMALLGQPYQVLDHQLHSTPSIGIGVFPTDGEDADTLMRNSDTAMYHAKSKGRDNFQFFTAAMNHAAVERLEMEAGLRSAIEHDELFLHYQPQIDMRNGRVVAMEALVRWNHPEKGLIPPLKFIPIAEETGQIEEIGRWVLEQALNQVTRWRADKWPNLRVAVNLSARQLRGNDIVGLVARSLQRLSLPGSALELEITESVAMHDPVHTSGLLKQLREHGVALAIDDFGTGYSSLSYLKQLPLSCLKLDRSFVTDLEHDPNDSAICAATIQLAHNLGLAVVAEGVETAMQLDFLRDLGCDMSQGYYISKPLSVEGCQRFLEHNETNPVLLGAPIVGRRFLQSVA
jgi:diguanylate cyclase (GGDEF)-like protein/PAS domain S-box-containing protein